MNKIEIQYNEDIVKFFRNNKLHREDGPAVIHSNGTKFWYINGKQHRTNGPAMTTHNGDKA